MSTLLVQSGTFDDIADAIRAKTGKVASMTPLEMPQEIASISGGGGETKSVSYLKWKITKVRGTTPHNGVLQATEFKLYQNGTLYPWNANASATSDMTPISGYEASKLIDGSNSTKFATSQWGNVQTNECNIIFSLGETITIDAKTTYSYITGNDETSRDPISWVLYGSADGTNWEELDSQTDFTSIIGRTTETLINGFLIAKVSGGSPIDYAIEQGQTTSTSTATASLTEDKYYLFSTVYGDSTFSGAIMIVGDTKPVFSASGIVRTGCIIKATSSTVTYSRSGNVSANEYTEIDVIPDADIGGVGSVWNSGTAISSIKDDLYFLTLGDGETGNIVGADILVEHELVDTVSNGTRFLIVKATGNSIALDNSHTFYYRRIGIVL